MHSPPPRITSEEFEKGVRDLAERLDPDGNPVPLEPVHPIPAPRSLKASDLGAEKAIEGWFRSLKDGRLEVLLKTPEVRIRVSGSPERIWQAVEMFEEWTGLQVEGNAEWRRPPRTGKRALAGQLTIDQAGDDDGTE